MRLIAALLLTIFSFSALDAFAGERDMKKTMKGYIKKNKEVLLASSFDFGNVWKNVKIGFKHNYRVLSLGYDIFVEYELVEIEGEFYIFDYFVDGEKKDYQKAFVNGLEYRYRNGKIEDQHSFDKCISFKIGKCTFEGMGRTKQMQTTYKKGVWERKWIYGGLAGYANRYSVYDQYGLVIFEWTKYENKLQGQKRLESKERLE